MESETTKKPEWQHRKEKQLEITKKPEWRQQKERQKMIWLIMHYVQAASAADGNVATATRQSCLNRTRADMTTFIIKIFKNATATLCFF